MTANEEIIRFSKSREHIIGRVKRSELSSIQGTQYSEEELVVRERFPISTDSLPVREPGTNGNHAPISQAQNDGSISNSQ